MAKGLVGVLPLISATYCFWLMTIPLSYNLVYVVVIGFIVSLGVFVMRLRRSDRAPRSPQTPATT